jgi:ATP-dependent exoDNAse (exonuclease V) beta subunit
VEAIPRAAGRPHGERFGALVHATLLRAPFSADETRLGRIAAATGRMLGATAEEVRAAASAAAAALKSPLFARAAAAPECRREFGLTMRRDDGRVVEGVADLAFAENSDAGRRWTVVDFKTDVDIAPRLAEYRAQVALYMRALARATGDRVEGALLWV